MDWGGDPEPREPDFQDCTEAINLSAARDRSDWCRKVGMLLTLRLCEHGADLDGYHRPFTGPSTILEDHLLTQGLLREEQALLADHRKEAPMEHKSIPIPPIQPLPCTLPPPPLADPSLHEAEVLAGNLVKELENIADHLKTIHQRISALPAYVDAPFGLPSSLNKSLARVEHYINHRESGDEPISTVIREWQEAMALAQRRQARAGQ